MPKSQFSIPHQLGTEEAKKRIISFTATAKQRPGLASNIQDSWSGDTGNFSMKVMGMAVAGRVETKPDAIHVEVEYPFAALPFKSQIEHEIQGQAQRLLS